MKSRNGFTLIELLVVIAIIGILAAIIFPVYAQAKKSAYKSSDLSNMNSLRSAIQLYKADQGAFPPALLGFVSPYENSNDGTNIVPPNAIRGALYPKRVESLSVFRPALDKIADNLGTSPYGAASIEAGTNPLVTAAVWPNGIIGGSAGDPRQRYGPTNGFIMRAATDPSTGCVVVPAYYYKISGYDVAPASNASGAKMESHYQLFWSGWTVPANPCSPSPSTAAGTGESGSGSDEVRQLGYTDPPETTVVTWDPFFRDYQNNTPIHQKQDLVLFLAGNARPMDSNDVFNKAWAIKP